MNELVALAKMLKNLREDVENLSAYDQGKLPEKVQLLAEFLSKDLSEPTKGLFLAAVGFESKPAGSLRGWWDATNNLEG